MEGAILNPPAGLNSNDKKNLFKVCRQIDFCYGHRLLHYEGKCKFPHGHNGRVEIEIVSGTLDQRGMVVDFSDIKRVIQTWIDQELDHRMLLHREDPLVKPLKDLGEPVFLMDDNPTAENIAKLIYHYAVSQGFAVTQVKLWETYHSFAVYERGS